jgi:hypothetical protein
MGTKAKLVLAVSLVVLAYVLLADERDRVGRSPMLLAPSRVA